MSDERVKRPPLERVRPDRAWNGLLRRPQAPASSQPSPSARVEDVVARSVELGYRVVDDYIKRGQEAARRIRAGAYGPGEIAEDVQGVAGQLVRSASDLAGAWVEFAALAGMGTAARGATAPPAATSPAADAATTPTTGTADAAATEPQRVRLCVAAERPIETSFDLRPVAAHHRLVVYPLRMDADASIHIDRARVESGDGRTTVIRIDVPPTQPAGRYVGLVVDDTTNVPVGEISLVVPPAG